MSRVCVIIVSFNTRDLLRKCLGSVEHHHDVVVVDNASIDGSASMVELEFPRAKLIKNDSNVGFGAANNQGLAVIQSKYALFLNSDAAATPGAIDRLADLLDSEDTIMAVGGQLLNPDGTTQSSSANALTLWAVFCEQFYLEKLFPRSRLLSPYWNTLWLAVHEQPLPTEQVMGACLMARPVTRFDERFFLYCEDTELCFRLRQTGTIYYVPGAKFHHELGASSKATRWESVARYYRGKELFFRLHFGVAASWICLILNRLGALMRLIVSLPLATVRRPGAKQKVILFCRVFLAPISGPPRPDRR